MEIHEIASDKERPDIMDLRENGYYHLRNIKESVFEISDSKDSIGLQITDLCLYMVTHKEFIRANRDQLPNSVTLLEYILSKSIFFEFTFNTFSSELSALHSKVMSTDLSEKDIAKGKQLIIDLEEKYKNQLKNGINK